MNIGPKKFGAEISFGQQKDVNKNWSHKIMCKNNVELRINLAKNKYWTNKMWAKKIVDQKRLWAQNILSEKIFAEQVPGLGSTVGDNTTPINPKAKMLNRILFGGRLIFAGCAP